MSSSTQHLDVLTSGQAGKETTANAVFDAASPAAFFGRRASTTTGLTWGYYGGVILVDGAVTEIPDSTRRGTVTLTTNATNYVEITRAGSISANTSAFTAGRVPLYTIVVNVSGVVTSYTDHRFAADVIPGCGIAAIVMGSDANKTATATECRCPILEVTSSVSLGATRDIVLPLTKGLGYTVFNSTTGAQSLQFIGASGTGITVGNAKRAILYCDGTNWVRVTADT